MNNVTKDTQDYQILARTAFGEARSETAIGQVAVMYSVINRARWRPIMWWGGTIEDVAFCHHQYDCFWLPGPDQKATLAWDPDGDNPEAAILRLLAAACLDGHISDPTHGATSYYYPPSVTAMPKWATTEWFRGVFGKQRFYAVPPVMPTPIVPTVPS